MGCLDSIAGSFEIDRPPPWDSQLIAPVVRSNGFKANACPAGRTCQEKVRLKPRGPAKAARWPSRIARPGSRAHPRRRLEAGSEKQIEHFLGVEVGNHLKICV